MFTIGPHQINSPVILAPMAGVTDLPFRKLCHQLGAGMVVGEMVSANPKLRHSKKSLLRLHHHQEISPRIVQIAGGDAQDMRESAKYNADRGAEIIDINMGCPAKKVCHKAAGSALLKDESLVAEIVKSVVDAVDIPVTLKIRTGWDQHNRNAIRIAKIAEELGIAALAVHGRTRADRFNGDAEYETIAQIRQQITIPLIANGDITTPQKAKQVLDITGADAIMIGRAAQGHPWIFAEIQHFLTTGKLLNPPSHTEVLSTLIHHVKALYDFYGEYMGVRIARKHVGWYLKSQRSEFCREFNMLETANEQLTSLHTHLGPCHSYG